MTLSRTSSAVAGVALALMSTFNAQAEAIHPILDTSTAATAYSGRLINTVDAAGVEQAQYLTRGAVVDLEAALKAPANAPRMVYFPQAKDIRLGDAFVGFAVPPKSLYNVASIPFCVGKAGGDILLKGDITLTGQVETDPTQAPSTASPNPCSAWLKQAGASWMPQQTPPVSDTK